ncbi:MAG: TIGR04190 family B12-binding domain/radical SAM domain protein [Anaerolineales bacterium]|nr:TIGR04190 family B12-binding domain/radical SAM domain protein [Anaerolineales bacterium]
MFDPDVIFLHAPAVYDFRQRATLWGPISDLVPSTPVFEMYPIGLTTLAEYLERSGYRTRIINLAVRMLQSKLFDVEKLLAKLKKPLLFGIDLHWLPHAHGALEVAELVKKYHPDTPIVFGGFSASYYHDEIIQNYPQVDYVLRGDSTEEPLLQLVEAIASHRQPVDVPNLTWRDEAGEMQVNPSSYIPENLDHVLLNYRQVIKAVARYRDLASYIPFAKWMTYPITAALSCRGCTHNCTICGGSAFASKMITGRERPAFRKAEDLANDIRTIHRFNRGPIFVLGDIRQAGMDYARRFLREIHGYQGEVIIEFFTPAPRSFIEEVAAALPNFVMEVSLESHDPTVRELSGKPYSGRKMEETIQAALDVGCKRVDVFFMIGMPGQDYQSVMDTIDYCGELLRQQNGDNRLWPFISPLAPFLDPGSLAYEQPEKYGYIVRDHTLADHVEALLKPTWKHVLSYETRWMTRDEIARATYESGLRLNQLKVEYGLIAECEARQTEDRIKRAVGLMAQIDEMVVKTAPEMLGAELLKIKHEIDVANESTVCEKEELDIPVNGIPVRPLVITRMLLEDGWAKIKRLFSANGKPKNGKHGGNGREYREVVAEQGMDRTRDP